MQYQFTLRQRVSAASWPSSGKYRTYKKAQQSEHSMGSLIPLSAHFVGLMMADLRLKHVALNVN